MNQAPRTLEHPALIAVGPWPHGEFAQLRAELDPQSRWPVVPTLSALLDSPARPHPPDLLLIAQPRPGTLAQSDVERWRAAHPLAPLVVIAGSWCEGELRTGRPLAGVIRLYWHEFAAWWRTALAQLSAGRCPPWSAPLDDVRAGTRLEIPARLRDSGDTPRTLAVDATDFAVFEAIAAATASEGWQCLWQPRHRPDLWNNQSSDAELHAGLWDGGQLDAPERRGLEHFSARLASHRAPVLALLDFPRPEHLAAALSCGAAAILGKPYSITALMAELSRRL